MPLDIECRVCGEGFSVDEEQAGREVNCPVCGRAMTVQAEEDLAVMAELDRMPAPSERDEEAAIPLNAGVPASDIDEVDEGDFSLKTEAATDHVVPVEPGAGGLEVEHTEPVLAEEEPAPTDETDGDDDSGDTPAETEGSPSRIRALNLSAAAVAIATALVIAACIDTLCAGLAGVRLMAPPAIPERFLAWCRGVPSAFRSGMPDSPDQLGTAGFVVVCLLLMVLALRALFLTHVLDRLYATRSSKRNIMGLFGHLTVVMSMLGLVGWAATTLAHEDTSRRYFVCWLFACYMLAAGGWFILVSIISRVQDSGVSVKMWNNALCGMGLVAVLLFGGVPLLPFSVMEQCALVAALNSALALCIVGGVFGEQKASALKQFGFLAVAGIMVSVVAVLFAAT